MTTTLVTGATGTIGSKVVRDLAERDLSVRAFVRDVDRATAAFGRDAEIAPGDLAEPDDVRLAMKDVSSVFLACGNDPRQVELESNVIDAAVEAGARIVKLSILGAERGSPVAFWDHHARIEQRLRESGLPNVILQPTFFMSNLLASLATIRQAGQFFLPAGDARVALIDPTDVAIAATAALIDESNDGRTYRLTGPAALTFDAIAEQLSVATGRTVQYVDVPDDAARGALAESGMPPWVSDNIVAVFGRLRTGAHSTVTGDFRELTGRQPRAFAEFAGEVEPLIAS